MKTRNLCAWLMLMGLVVLGNGATAESPRGPVTVGNLIPNSKWQEADSANADVPLYFSPGTEGGNPICVWEKDGYLDGRALSVCTPTDGDTGYWAVKVPVKPDTVYTLSLYYKTKTMQQPEIVLSPEGPSTKGGFDWYLRPQRPETWEYVSRDFQSKNWRAVTIKFYLYQRPEEKVWFALPVLREPAFVAAPIAPDGIVKQGEVKFQWKPVEGVKDYTVQFSADRSFSDPGKTTTRTGVTGDSLTCALTEGRWFWRVGVVDARNEICYSMPKSLLVVAAKTVFKNATVSPQIKPLPPPPAATAEGTSEVKVEKNYVTLNGRPFFPLGLYCYSHLSLLKEIKDAGFNTILSHDNYRPEQMDALMTNDLRVILGLTAGTSIGEATKPEELDEKLPKGALRYRKHPALLAYWLDEPDAWKPAEKTLAMLTRMNAITKQLDSAHPTTWCFASPDRIAELHATCDIVTMDPYPLYPQLDSMPFAGVAGCMDVARQATRSEKLIWIIPQAFDQSVAQTGKPAEGEYRPNPKELRCLTYLPIVHGAKAILYWASDSGKCDISKWPKEWAALKNIAKEVDSLIPVLLMGTAADHIRVDASDNIHWLCRRYEGKAYLIAVNVATDKGYISVGKAKAADGKPSQVRVLFENRATEMLDSFSDSFDQHDVHVYEID